MNIPDCYDPVYQAERREAKWDAYIKPLRRCDLCHTSIYPGNRYRECFNGTVCSDCFEELSEYELIEEGD